MGNGAIDPHEVAPHEILDPREVQGQHPGLRSRKVLGMPAGLINSNCPSSTVPLPPHPHRLFAGEHVAGPSSSPRDHPRGRVCCLLSSVSGIGQLIEIASRAVQPFLDGSRCRFFCCSTSLDGFLAIIPRRQGWRVLGLVHEPQHSSANHGGASPARYPARAARSVFGFGCDPLDGLMLVSRIVAGDDCARALTGTLTSRSHWSRRRSSREFSCTWRCGIIG
jgi:hypothetical protein